MNLNRGLLIPLAVLATASAPDQSLACMAFPSLAACTVDLGRKLKHDLHDKKNQIQDLEKRVRSEKRLFLHEVASLAGGRPGVRTNIDLIENESLRKAAAGGTPIAFASRLEILRPKLTDKEWNEGVELWGDYIARSEDLWEPKEYEQYCGLQQEGKALAVDVEYTFAWPFILAKTADANEPDTGAALVVAPLVTAAGVVSLGADVVTFIPNVAASAGEKLRHSIHVKLSARAFRRFADLVRKYEQAHA